MAGRRSGNKKIGSGDITGDQGVAFIHGVVAEMKFLWKALGPPEAGIDGHIELRDDISGEVHNAHILVQSKAGKSYFVNENDASFEFLCDEADLRYWLSGNFPVILVVSRNGKEGYWKALKDYFNDPKRLATRRVIFSKAEDRFDIGARTRLIEIGEPPGAGLHIAPIPKREQLISNLLPVQLNCESVFLASTPVSSEADFDRRAVENSDRKPYWAVHEHTVTSFTDLREPAFKNLVDDGSVEEFSTADFSDPELQGRFIHLMNRCLRQYLLQLDIAFHRHRELFYFESFAKNRPRSFAYQSIKERTTRDVVTWKGGNGKFQLYCRHCAADLRFRCYDGEWFLEITPNYIFTTDGYHGSKFSSSLLRGIKQLEKNKAVLGQTLMWCDLLSLDQGLMKEDRPINFGKLLRDDLPCGIDDKDWLPPKLVPADEEGDLFS